MNALRNCHSRPDPPAIRQLTDVALRAGRESIRQPADWIPASRLREARYGGRRKVAGMTE